jgi:hypothetical protein
MFFIDSLPQRRQLLAQATIHETQISANIFPIFRAEYFSEAIFHFYDGAFSRE